LSRTRPSTTLALVAVFATVAPVGATAAQPIVEWGRRVANSGRSGCCHGLGADAAGSVYVTGAFDGTIPVDRHVLESAGGSDIFLVKLDREGRGVWAVRGGGTGADHPTELAVAPDGHCYVVGQIDATSRFGDKYLPYFGERKSFLARYGPDGECAWVVTAPGKIEESVKAVAVAPDGGAVVAGDHVPKDSDDDVPECYLAKYDPGGEREWLVRIAGTGRSLALAVDGAGVTYVAGSLGDGADAGRRGGPRRPYEKKPWLAAFDADGKRLWGWTGEVGADDDASARRRSWGRSTGVAAIPRGGCWVVGEVEGPARFGRFEPSALGGRDVFLARFDAGGKPRWVVRAGGPADDDAFDVARTEGGGVIVGSYRESATFGATTVEAVTAQDVFVAAFDEAGGCTGVRTGSGPGESPQDAIAFEVAAGPAGTVLVSGWFRDALRFGDVSIRGGRDAHFVARLRCP